MTLRCHRPRPNVLQLSPALAVLHYRSSATWGSAASGERSVRGSMPQYGRGGPPAAAVAAEAMRMFRCGSAERPHRDYRIWCLHARGVFSGRKT